MPEYYFKLQGDWDYGPETVKTDIKPLSSEKAARAYAIKLIMQNEMKVPARAYVVIYGGTYPKLKEIGDVTSYKPIDGKRSFRYISPSMLAKGQYNPKPLNLDGSFKGTAKKKKIPAPFGL